MKIVNKYYNCGSRCDFNCPHYSHCHNCIDWCLRNGRTGTECIIKNHQDKIREEGAYHKGYLDGRNAEIESNRYKPKDFSEKELLDKLKSFIKSLLSQQRQEIINQIKEMRLKAPSPPNRHRRGFNQAIDQIIQSLKEK